LLVAFVILFLSRATTTELLALLGDDLEFGDPRQVDLVYYHWPFHESTPLLNAGFFDADLLVWHFFLFLSFEARLLFLLLSSLLFFKLPLVEALLDYVLDHRREINQEK